MIEVLKGSTKATKEKVAERNVRKKHGFKGAAVSHATAVPANLVKTTAEISIATTSHDNGNC